MTTRGGRQRIPRPPGTQPGAPSPWSALPPEARRFTLAQVRQRLADLPEPKPAPIMVPDARPAAVLVALFEDAGEARLVLTKRPDTMPSHQGEIAFPGGKVDAVDDSHLAAALREAEEEVGLDPAQVEIIGQLDTMATIATRFTITPYVGLLRERPHLAAHPFEVVEVFDVALGELLAEGVFREERWDFTPINDAPGWEDRSVFFYELEHETVWGATARILTGLLAHLTGTG
ncbi:MAG: CoA pyrophosphatase [Acidimicrobiia bacterium]